MKISWEVARSRVQRMPGHTDIREAPEWLVKLVAEKTGFSVIEVVHAANSMEAAYEAFCTRSTPYDWFVVEVEPA